jgi:polyferredoxin
MRKISTITFPLLLMAAALLSSTAYSSDSECGGVFKKKCGKCHPVPSPLGYSKQVWDDYVEQMADEAKLSKPEKKCIMGLNTTIIPE